MTTPSITLAAWTSSWLRGHSSSDDLVDALHRWAPLHLVVADDEVTAQQTAVPATPAADLAVLLTAVRRAASPGQNSPAHSSPAPVVRLVLPAPGDVSALPAPSRFATAAVQTGHGVLVGGAGQPGIGLIPTIEGPDVLRWTSYALPELPLHQHSMGLGEAEFAIREAVRDAATAVSELALVGGSATAARAAVAQALTESSLHTYPDSLSARSLRILESADHVDAILTAADTLGTGTPTTGAMATLAVDAASALALETHLRPLRSAVRQARTAAINTAS
ncbi:MAG: hypothetical protein GX542_10070 [Rhodococcus sp.]|nr:hypothetical protein [Rhodococcus sp. (in: high G+C Gram-positive bacteria)]